MHQAPPPYALLIRFKGRYPVLENFLIQNLVPKKFAWLGLAPSPRTQLMTVLSPPLMHYWSIKYLLSSAVRLGGGLEEPHTPPAPILCGC